MNKCIICNKTIKEDHAFCLDCYNKYDKSTLIKKMKEHTDFNKDILCYDNYNNCLKYFYNISNYLKYVDEKLFDNYVVVSKSKMSGDLLEQALDDKKELLTHFNLKREFSSLVYLDTMFLMMKTFKDIDSSDVINNTSIYMEYNLPNLKEERIDYILGYKDKLIIVEMGQSDVLSIKDLANKKTKQLNNYLKVLKKEFPQIKGKNIISEVFVYSSNITTINKSIEHLRKMIITHFNYKFPTEILNIPR